MGLKIRDILTDEELQKVNLIKMKMITATTTIQLNHYQREFDNLIKKAKERYFKTKKEM